jgi:hypothetical protein
MNQCRPSRSACYRYLQGLCDGVRHRRICDCGTIVTGNHCLHDRFDDTELPMCCTEIRMAFTADEEEAF